MKISLGTKWTIKDAVEVYGLLQCPAMLAKMTKWSLKMLLELCDGPLFSNNAQVEPQIKFLLFFFIAIILGVI